MHCLARTRESGPRRSHRTVGRVERERLLIALAGTPDAHCAHTHFELRLFTLDSVGSPVCGNVARIAFRGPLDGVHFETSE